MQAKLKIILAILLLFFFSGCLFGMNYLQEYGWLLLSTEEVNLIGFNFTTISNMNLHNGLKQSFSDAQGNSIQILIEVPETEEESRQSFRWVKEELKDRQKYDEVEVGDQGFLKDWPEDSYTILHFRKGKFQIQLAVRKLNDGLRVEKTKSLAAILITRIEK